MRNRIHRQTDGRTDGQTNFNCKLYIWTSRSPAQPGIDFYFKFNYFIWFIFILIPPRFLKPPCFKRSRGCLIPPRFKYPDCSLILPGSKELTCSKASRVHEISWVQKSPMLKGPPKFNRLANFLRPPRFNAPVRFKDSQIQKNSQFQMAVQVTVTSQVLKFSHVQRTSQVQSRIQGQRTS